MPLAKTAKRLDAENKNDMLNFEWNSNSCFRIYRYIASPHFFIFTVSVDLLDGIDRSLELGLFDGDGCDCGWQESLVVVDSSYM